MESAITYFVNEIKKKAFLNDQDVYFKLSEHEINEIAKKASKKEQINLFLAFSNSKDTMTTFFNRVTNKNQITMENQMNNPIKPKSMVELIIQKHKELQPKDFSKWIIGNSAIKLEDKTVSLICSKHNELSSKDFSKWLITKESFLLESEFKS